MGAFYGLLGSVAWTGAQNTQLIATGSEPMAFTLDAPGLEFDSTGFAAQGISTHLKGLPALSGTIRQRFKTAQTGDLGLVTYSGGYTTNLNAWRLRVEVVNQETPTFGQTTRAFLPGKLSWGGEFSGLLDETTAVTLPGNANEPATGTFKLREAGGTDDALSGSIFTTRLGLGADPENIAPVSYTFRGSGDLTQSTPSAGTTIFPTGVVARPTVGTLTLTATTGRTFVGSAFWTFVEIAVAANQMTSVDIGFQYTGLVTPG